MKVASSTTTWSEPRGGRRGPRPRSAPSRARRIERVSCSLQPGASGRARVAVLLQGEPGGGRHVRARCARRAGSSPPADQPAQLGLGAPASISPAPSSGQRGRDQRAAGGAEQPVPELLGHERRHRMQQVQELGQNPARGGPGLRLRGRVAAGEQRLRQLDDTSRRTVPDEVVERAGGVVEPVALDRRPGPFGRLGESRRAIQRLTAGGRRAGRSPGRAARRSSRQKRGGVPELGARSCDSPRRALGPNLMSRPWAWCGQGASAARRRRTCRSARAGRSTLPLVFDIFCAALVAHEAVDVDRRGTAPRP